ncbi:hypothetical protein ES332_D09G067700v1 [Gossypium tomentosum]|uniref:Uncharacterized protein n=1 Tax=Gossypium tomentosum TaxID=34277 RepID=A0A5D2JG67_GOSTO|nr:hypothetical protein ES332_D09G067700v1 [Gossypium tomentosum]
MANSKIFLTHLRRSIPLSTYYLPHVTHLPLCPASRSHPNLPARVSPIPYPATRSFFTSSNNVEESILPVRAILSLLDGYHNLTGFPWWITIVTSTMAMRFALFPVVVIHLQKLKKIGELAPKLPSPLPPPMSGRSYKDHFIHFEKERKANGCPSYFWFFASFLTQVPCLFLWVTSIRRMSLDNYPGFDSGGALWFKNLTELPHDVSGFIFPFLIAGLHYLNVQISFASSSVGKVDSFLTKVFKFYLDILTLPLFGVSLLIPQGSLVYWVTNSSFSVIQLSVKHLSREEKDQAVLLLKLALERDPEYVKAMVVMGQTLMQKGLMEDAIEYLERAISKLSLAGHPTEVENVDLLILSSQWAGVVYMKQGKKAEGLAHLETIASLKEPEDPKSKAHYFDGLLLLASALFDFGRKAEALKFLKLVVAYNPKYNYLLEELKNEEYDFASNLASSRRRDY